MTNEEYLSQWIKWHRQYEIKAFRIFKEAIISTLQRIPIDNLNYYNYNEVVKLNIYQNLIEQAYIDVYTTIGLIHGNRVGRGINRDIKDFNKPLFNEDFQNLIIDWVRENCGLRITSVSNNLAKTIIELVAQSSEENLTIEQMQRFIRQRINSGLSRYEVLRIARTETTSAANFAALESGKNSGIVMDKVWIASTDNRTRRKPKNEWSHLAMNNVAVEQDANFKVVSSKGVTDNIPYPCAPGSSAGNAISCRCAVAFKPRRDKDGFVIRR